MEYVSEEDLRKVFNELKSHDDSRDYINFQDFEGAIREHNIQLMDGLQQDDPDFSLYCQMLFLMISSNIAPAQQQKGKKDTGKIQQKKAIIKQDLKIRKRNKKIIFQQAQQKHLISPKSKFDISRKNLSDSKRSTIKNKRQTKIVTINRRKVQNHKQRAFVRQIKYENRQRAKMAIECIDDPHQNIPLDEIQIDFENFKKIFHEYATLRLLVQQLCEKLGIIKKEEEQEEKREQDSFNVNNDRDDSDDDPDFGDRDERESMEEIDIIPEENSRDSDFNQREDIEDSSSDDRESIGSSSDDDDLERGSLMDYSFFRRDSKIMQKLRLKIQNSQLMSDQGKSQMDDMFSPGKESNMFNNRTNNEENEMLDNLKEEYKHDDQDEDFQNLLGLIDQKSMSIIEQKKSVQLNSPDNNQEKQGEGPVTLEEIKIEEIKSQKDETPQKETPQNKDMKPITDNKRKQHCASCCLIF